MCDSSLSLEGIADTCGITPSYLGRYFKKQTGFSPMQYVDIQRMNLAKELLLNTELPLKQIVAQVGYIDESNFIRSSKGRNRYPPLSFDRIIVKSAELLLSTKAQKLFGVLIRTQRFVSAIAVLRIYRRWQRKKALYMQKQSQFFWYKFYILLIPQCSFTIK